MANNKNVIPPIRGSFEAVARSLVRPVARPNPAPKMTRQSTAKPPSQKK